MSRINDYTPEELSKAIKAITNELRMIQNIMGGEIAKIDFTAPAKEVLDSLSATVEKQQQILNSTFLTAGITVNDLSTMAEAMTKQPLTLLSEMAKAVESINISPLLNDILSDIKSANISEMYSKGEITDDDIANEIKAQVSGVENTKASNKSEKVKKVLKAIAFQLVLILAALLFNPIDEAIKTKFIETFRVDEFWQKTGIIEFIENLGVEDNAVSEEEAKASVDLPDSTNISKEKREELIHKISEIRSYIAKAKQDENTAQLMAYLGDLEKDVNGKKYGLVFEEHREAIDEVLDNYTPVLTEDEDLYIDNGGNINFLIEGDNLASLKLLEKTHKGKIDLIYIDPPYNTGKKDFIYNDKFVEKVDLFKHSKWLSFLQKRLVVAKELLSINGTIFISIDDGEQAVLRDLCDSVFGSENFVANCIWEKKFSPQNDARWFSDNHDFILVYAKRKETWKPNLLSRTEEMNARYSNPDNDPRGPWASSDFSARTFSESGYYPIITPSGKKILPSDTRSWITNEETFKQLLKEGRIWFGKDGSNVPRIKTYLSEVQQGVVCKTIWSRNDVGDTQEGTRDLKAIFEGKGVFTSPKPIRLIERVINLSTYSNSIILDFFAGSGTTGHAVMKLNAEDGGNRRFILCTNNENNICRDVTYERIKRVIEKEDYKASLKYYQVQYIPIEEKMYYEYADSLLLHIRELVELENGINFNGNAEIAIVLTDEELGEFIGGIDENNKCKKLYMGHDLLPDEEQDKIIKDHDIEICIIPDYYYRDLQER